MPRQASSPEIRVKDIIASLEPTIPMLGDLIDAFGAPFMAVIKETTISLISAVQNIKENKEQCLNLIELIQPVLYTIINLHMKSETTGCLPPAMLYDVGKFTEHVFPIIDKGCIILTVIRAIRKIHTFVDAQQQGNWMKKVLRHNEISNLFKECHAGIQHAVEVFKIDPATTTLTSTRELRMAAEKMHQELLELVSNISIETTSSGAASVNELLSTVYHTLKRSLQISRSTLNGSHVSSGSFSLLPAKPKIFHGRESELQDILKLLGHDSPRIVILGGGGMGKTTLAKAALHHPDMTAKYDLRLFVACDSALSGIEIAGLVGAHIGLKPGKNLIKPVIRFISSKKSCLLILDNLETPWEPLESRSSVEELLSLLADIHHLALVITMRGAERPGNVRWTRPFLPPLDPLSTEAARDMFMEITDDTYESTELDQLLGLANNMPLAVDLLAHLVEYDSCSGVLSRWETEKTSLLSVGSDRRSNLDISIGISLSSPRLTAHPGAVHLLSLLSILPDGLSYVELLQSALPIKDVLACKTALLSTGLAFKDESQRLKSLVPIRQHMLKFHRVESSLVEALTKHFQMVLELYREHNGAHQTANTVQQITSALANVHQVLLAGLHPQNANLVQPIRCTISLNNFSRITGRGRVALMDKIPDLLPRPCDQRLEVEFITEMLFSHLLILLQNAEELIAQGRPHCEHLDDPVLQSRFYFAVSRYYEDCAMPEAMKLLDEARIFARSAGDKKTEAQIVANLARMKMEIGEYTASKALANEGQRLARLCANPLEEARSFLVQVMCCKNLGQFQESLFMLRKGRELLSLCGLSKGNLDYLFLITQAEIHLLKSEYTEARALFHEITQNIPADQDIYNHGIAMLMIAATDVHINADKTDVQATVNKVEALFKGIDAHFGKGQCEQLLAGLYLREGETIMAKTMFKACLHSFWATNSSGASDCLGYLADITRWGASNLRWTSRYPMVYLAFSIKSGEKLGLCMALRCLADLFLANEDHETAESLLVVALLGFTYMDVHRSRADCMLRLSDIKDQQGNLAKARELWTEALPLFQRSLQTNEVAQIEARLSNDAEH